MKKGRRRKTAHHIRHKVILFIAFLLVVVYCGFDLLSPLPAIEATTQPSPFPNPGTLVVNWPNAEESSVGVLGYGLVESHGAQQETPTASIAKLVTALAVLKQKPLAIGEQGPVITINAADVADYQNFISEDGSVVQVTVGEQITEYQALQAMLLPSANNMADTLAVWAFGSNSSYTAYANQLVGGLGMSHTTISDPSGFSPNTLSTSNDLIILGEAALNNSVIAQIVSQPSAVIPVAGQINNVNSLVGQSGVIGIKTGNTDQAGGCFLTAAKYALSDNQSLTIITSIMKSPTLQVAINSTPPILQSIKSQIQLKDLPAGYSVAKYSTPWGETVNATTQTNIPVPSLAGVNTSSQVTTIAIQPPKSAGTEVGTAAFGIGSSSPKSSSVALAQKLTGPSLFWRLIHPKYIFE